MTAFYHFAALSQHDEARIHTVKRETWVFASTLHLKTDQGQAMSLMPISPYLSILCSFGLTGAHHVHQI